MLDFLRGLLLPSEIALLVTALIITTSEPVEQIITTYQLQSWVLAGVTGLTAVIKVIEGGRARVDVAILILFIVVLPIMLAVFIKRLLIRVTIPTVTGTGHVHMQRQAQQEWLKYKTAVNIQPWPTVNTQFRDLLIFVVLVSVAFLIAFQIIAGEFPSSDRIGLMVSLALHLVGLYNMVVKREIISQVLGLLIMDHGLYLAVVKIVAIPVPATFFVISLYFYTLITIFILVILLPRVRDITGSIDLSEISEKSDLKG